MKDTLNKEALVHSAKQELQGRGITLTVALAAYETLSWAMREALTQGSRVTLPGLGYLHPVKRAAKRVRNPRTGEFIDVPAKRTVKFVPLKSVEKEM